MPNVKRADLEALHSMIEQAHLIVNTEPMIAGGIPRLRELLDTAERLADFLVTDSAPASAPADTSRRRS
jgi:hypothetical protein